MKRLVIVLIAFLCSLLFSCNKTSEIQCPDFDLQEKATSSVLLKGLDKFNYDLSTKRNIPRIYDYKSDSIIITLLNRVQNSEEEKTALYIGMVVASYSSKYWGKCEN